MESVTNWWDDEIQVPYSPRREDEDRVMLDVSFLDAPSPFKNLMKGRRLFQFFDGEPVSPRLRFHQTFNI